MLLCSRVSVVVLVLCTSFCAKVACGISSCISICRSSARRASHMTRVQRHKSVVRAHTRLTYFLRAVILKGQSKLL